MSVNVSAYIMSKKILVIGGDPRIDTLCASMAADGLNVSRYTDDMPLKTALKNSDIVILGLPASTDDETVNAPGLRRPILMNDLFRLMNAGQLLLGGKLSDKTKAALRVCGIKYADYLAREEFEILNAVPSAEGAVQIAMEELPVTLKDCPVIITGYGRIGKYLAKILAAMGARVTVFARKDSDLALARSNNLSAMPYSFLPETAMNAQVIFNTVPAEIIFSDTLSVFGGGLIIDLAGGNGCVDPDAAAMAAVRVIRAPGLPGRVAPVTAGEIIKETIYNIFREMGEQKWT